MANRMCLNDAKHHLLQAAKHLKALAVIEEREARKVTPVQSFQLEA